MIIGFFCAYFMHLVYERCTGVLVKKRVIRCAAVRGNSVNNNNKSVERDPGSSGSRLLHTCTEVVITRLKFEPVSILVSLQD